MKQKDDQRRRLMSEHIRTQQVAIDAAQKSGKTLDEIRTRFMKGVPESEVDENNRSLVAFIGAVTPTIGANASAIRKTWEDHLTVYSEIANFRDLFPVADR